MTGSSHAAGKFIVLEGGEGAGKSTQCAALAARLRQAGLTVVETREPGGTPGAEAIRVLLKSGALQRHGPDVEAMLIAAARMDHVAEVIQPALHAGKWVVCDRFAGSTRVYQGAGSGVSEDLIATLERVSTAGTLPDLVLVLDLPAELGMRRAAQRQGAGGGRDRFERQSLAYHRRLRTAFRDLVKRYPARHVLINAGAEPDQVESRIWEVVRERLAIGSAGQAPDDTGREAMQTAEGGDGAQTPG